MLELVPSKDPKALPIGAIIFLELDKPLPRGWQYYANRNGEGIVQLSLFKQKVIAIQKVGEDDADRK